MKGRGVIGQHKKTVKWKSTNERKGRVAEDRRVRNGDVEEERISKCQLE